MSDCEIHATGSSYQATTGSCLHANRNGNATDNTQPAPGLLPRPLTRSGRMTWWPKPASRQASRSGTKDCSLRSLSNARLAQPNHPLPSPVFPGSTDNRRRPGRQDPAAIFALLRDAFLPLGARRSSNYQIIMGPGRKSGDVSGCTGAAVNCELNFLNLPKV